MLYKSKDDEIKGLKSRLAESIKSIGELQLLVMQKQKENEQARTDAWSMMERWSDTKDKLDAYRQAEEQGLLIKLPCMVGDTLYWIIKDEMYMHRTIRKVTVQCFVWWITHGFCVKVANMVENIPCKDIPLSEFGITLFLTREAAVEALKGGGAE